MKKLMIVFALITCLLAPVIGRSQVIRLGVPSNQTKEAIQDSLDDAEEAHDYMKRSAFEDSARAALARQDSIVVNRIGAGTDYLYRFSMNDVNKTYVDTSGNLFAKDHIVFDLADKNTRIGYEAGKYLTAGTVNSVYIGYQAGSADNVTGKTNAADYNVGVGYRALYANDSGDKNIAIGWGALDSNTIGTTNIAIGAQTLTDNIFGISNVAIGDEALTNNTSNQNTGVGYQALKNNVGGSQNAAYGFWSLITNTSGDYNVGFGPNTLYYNSTGDRNIAVGSNAGYYETGSDAFYIGNILQDNIAGDKAYSLMYGTFAGVKNSTAGQGLTLNGDLTVTKEVFASNVNYNEGTLSEPTIIDAAGVAVSIASVDVLIRATKDWTGSKLYKHTVPANATLALTASSLNYIYVSYNGGSPIYAGTAFQDTLDYSMNIPVAKVLMGAADIEYQIGNNAMGLSTAIRGTKRVLALRNFERKSGFATTETATNVVNIASGVVFHGVNIKNLDAAAQGGGGIESDLVYHIAGVWSDSTITTYENMRYDNGTALVTLTPNRYAVNWIFRSYADDEIDIMLGTGDYTLAQALASQMPSLPDRIDNFYFIVSKIIVQRGDATAYSIQDIVNTTFSTAGVTAHSDLSGLTTGDDHTQYTLRADVPDSTDAALARADSSKITNNALSSDDIAGLSDRLSEALFDVDFGSAGIMKTDGSGTYSILTDGSTDWEAAHDRVAADSANWNTAFTDRLKWDGGATGLTAATGRSSLELGSLATLSAIDSALAAANSMAIGDVAGLSDRLSEKLAKDAAEDSTTAYLDRTTIPQLTATIVLADTFKTANTVKVVIPLRTFVFGAEDSTDAFTTQTVVIDTTETSPRNRLQAKAVHCESYTSQIIRFLTSRVFNPANPDSVGLDMLSTATHLDSTAVRIIGKGLFVDTSTVWNSDWFTSGTVNTVEHFSFVAPEFIENNVYEWRIEFRATRDKEIEVSDIFYR